MNRNLLAEEYPFESHSLDLDGVRYHYVDEGSGEPLLLVHGNPTWSFAWRHLIRDLSRDYRVIAVDHVGCGLSDKPADYPYLLRQHVSNLKQLVETLDLKGISLFGHDWGGCIGMGMAGEMPDRIRRIVLMNTAAFRSQRIPLRIAVCRIPVLGALGVRGLNLFSRAALTMAVSHRDRMTPAVRAGYLAPYDTWAHRIAVHRFVQDIPLSPGHPSYDTLVGIESRLERLQERPMLLIWGERDWCFTTEFLAEWQQRFPDAEVMRIPEAGHYVFEDAREQMLPRIRQFLET
ncbi:Haloalkane dehalogenase [Maioricimonas rarisocia]|uniref:Haloalkane dehalogenase n=1 Tax=Maioricimonas rarisocia TaxID=2528026 RepID=A0A517Z8J3_9PLAN|nr:alpha/beta fold hydrolase [Maioricimonas rarisocia]QDU38784.1 Haloalkane dehalogenase [Maioricimonas rarisocia]